MITYNDDERILTVLVENGTMEILLIRQYLLKVSFYLEELYRASYSNATWREGILNIVDSESIGYKIYMRKFI